MKLQVDGIEEIEITDPQGLCNPPVPQLPSLIGTPPAPNPALPGQPSPFRPQPSVPTPFGDPNLPGISPRRPKGPWIGDIDMPDRHPNYRTNVPDRTKWGVGSDAIQRAGQQVDPDKWEKNWQAGMPQPAQLSERSKRILGEDPDGS